MPAIQLPLLSKPGCHLCDDARAAVTEVIATFEVGRPEASIALEEKSILDDQALFDEYVEEIPVVLINGRVHTVWRVDRDRLTTALTTELEESA